MNPQEAPQYAECPCCQQAFLAEQPRCPCCGTLNPGLPATVAATLAGQHPIDVEAPPLPDYWGSLAGIDPLDLPAPMHAGHGRHAHR